MYLKMAPTPGGNVVVFVTYKEVVLILKRILIGGTTEHVGRVAQSV